MGHRLSKIATRTGDTGTTGLGDGSRVPKDDLRIHAIGDVDELNSLIGVLLGEELPDEIRTALLDVQHDLFDVGGELSIPGSEVVDETAVAGLEAAIERHNAVLPPLKEFILPGGGRAAAHCHLARTVCRRAERGIVSLGRHEPVNQAILSYMNRLSDLLFIFGRILARGGGEGEVLWNRQRSTE